VKETVVPVYFMIIILTHSLHTYWSVFKVLHKIELPIDYPLVFLLSSAFMLRIGVEYQGEEVRSENRVCHHTYFFGTSVSKKRINRANIFFLHAILYYR